LRRIPGGGRPLPIRQNILFISKGGIFKKEKILGAPWFAPHAGELIQELILANTSELSVNANL